ncbi:hypothetical protein RJT34_00937 [Clitoria ternatea]|uniref:Uncharacterized protein n=1 Tax=Clitoria ternatea TaxID=43366 RepID=A0AAN9KII4_CLITE
MSSSSSRTCFAPTHLWIAMPVQLECLNREMNIRESSKSEALLRDSMFFWRGLPLDQCKMERLAKQLVETGQGVGVPSHEQEGETEAGKGKGSQSTQGSQVTNVVSVNQAGLSQDMEWEDDYKSFLKEKQLVNA